MMQAWDFLAALRADGLPIIGVSLPDLAAPDSWRFFSQTLGDTLSPDQTARARAIITATLALEPVDQTPPLETAGGHAIVATLIPTGATGQTVAELLAAAHNAHLAYRQALQHAPTTVRAELGRAYSLRRAADEADPTHVDPAWAADRVPHAEMMAFYAEQLNR